MTLKIYDVLGQEVKTLVNEFQVSAPGAHEPSAQGFKSVEWDAGG